MRQYNLFLKETRFSKMWYSLTINCPSLRIRLYL